MGSVPANPNDGRFSTSPWLNDAIEGDVAREKTLELLELMGLPDPEHHEYFTGPKGNVDRLYLPEGLIVSLVYRRTNPIRNIFNRDGIKAPIFEARKIVDERILQPWLQVDFTSACCAELNIGTKPNKDADLAKAFAKDLKASGIKLDPQPENIGMMGDHSFVSNRRAIQPLNVNVINQGGSAGWQNECYGAMSDLAAEAYETRSPEKFRRLREICAEIVRLPVNDPNHIIHASWKDNDNDRSPRRRDIAAAARWYERRLAAA